MMYRVLFCSLLMIAVHCFAWPDAACADLTYSVLPQTLIHETNDNEEFITGGYIVMVDSAADDGILSAGELIEVTVFNTLAGTIHAYDDFDFSNINAAFDGQYLSGSLRVQHTDNGEGFVEWWGGIDMISISDINNTEYAQLSPWQTPHRFAVNTVPEPSGIAGVVLMSCSLLVRRRRQLACRPTAKVS